MTSEPSTRWMFPSVKVFLAVCLGAFVLDLALIRLGLLDIEPWPLLVAVALGIGVGLGLLVGGSILLVRRIRRDK